MFTEPPNTYTNSTTNISGWIVANTSSSGFRGSARRWRIASVQLSFSSQIGPRGMSSSGAGARSSVERSRRSVVVVVVIGWQLL